MSTDSPTFLRSKWLTKNMNVGGSQTSAIHDAFVTREQLLDALKTGEKLTEYDGIGEKTAGAIWEWYKNVYGATVEAEDTLVLDDDGLHIPDWLVGFSGRLTVETPNVTMSATAKDLPESCALLKAFPEAGTWNERLSEGQIALSTPGHPEVIYDIDDQRTEEASR